MKKHNLQIKNFLSIYFPILMGFLFFRIIIQIDLAMLAPFGVKLLAAYGVPAKIMLLDTVFAFTLGPVASIYVSHAKTYQEKLSTVQNILALGFLLSILITLAGFVLYPLILQASITDITILKPAKLILFWQNLSIPFRILVFVSTLILHALNLGKSVLKIDFLILVLNPILNHALIKLYGPEGIFISTYFLNIFSCVLFYLVLKKYFKNTFSSFSINIKFIRDFYLKSQSEFLRLIFYFGQGFLIVFLLARSTFVDATALLAGFSPAFEFGQLVLMFFMAFMRCTGIFAAQKHDATILEKISFLKPIILIFFPCTVFFSISIFFLREKIGGFFYSLEGIELSVFKTYILFFAWSMPFVFINSLARGVLQSEKQFTFIFKVELIARWFVAVPTFIIALYAESLLLLWNYLLVSAIFELVLLAKSFAPKKHFVDEFSKSFFFFRPQNRDKQTTLKNST